MVGEKSSIKIGSQEVSPADRTLLLFAAILVIAGERVSSAADVFTAYASSHVWTLVHEVQFGGSVLVIFGLLALFSTLNVNTGILGMLNRFGASSAVAALSLNGVLYAVDGVGLKQAVDAWLSAPASERLAYFAAIQG